MQPAANSIKAILYDLDGTLIDNFEAIHRAIAHAQKTLGLAPSSYEKVRATVGGSIEVTMARLIGPELAPQAIPHYLEHFKEVVFEGLKPMPGADWLLENLHRRGVRQAVLTNKRGDSAREVTAFLGWNKWVELVLGTHDTPWRKPAPEFTRHAVEKLGVKSEVTMFVGDSPFDIDAAATANLRCEVVTTGSHTREQLLAHRPPPVAAFESLYDLGTATFGLKRD